MDNHRFKNEGAHLGFNTGLDFELLFAQRYSFATGMGYEIRQGSLRYKTGDFVLRTKYEGKLPIPADALMETQVHYLTVPLTLKLRAIQIGYFSFFATGGFMANFAVLQKATCRAIDLKNERLEGMFYWGNLTYLLRVGVEYSLGGQSSIEGGICFNGSATSAYDPGKGRVWANSVQLRLGFIF